MTVLDSQERGLTKDARSLGRSIPANELTVVSSAARSFDLRRHEGGLPPQVQLSPYRGFAPIG
jgi:hypothetical protein